ncbi:hypothetical protein [uncultured Mediterranean phage uvDeep-CGR2-KM19-C37]|nr:hypothetical protein [uncultured Mediterranean phage uvDeep-CGR2-KM19-C37]
MPGGVVSEQLEDIAFLGGVYAEIENAWRDADFTEFLGDVITKLEESHRGFFANEASPSGESWPPLSEITILRKGHDAILLEKGPLSESLGGQTGDSIREIVAEQLFHGLSFGTSVEYAHRHQRGGKHLPQREHVGMTEATVDEITEESADKMVDMLKYTG